jgi:hypothetical protein
MGAAPFFSWAAGTQGDLRLDDGRAAAATPSPEVRRPRPSHCRSAAPPLPSRQEKGAHLWTPFSRRNVGADRLPVPEGEESRRSRHICLTSEGPVRGDPKLPERKWAQNGHDE